MSWLILFCAGLLEVVWAIGLKLHHGRPLYITATVIALISSFVLLEIAVREIPISTAYVVWTGIGIVGTVIVGSSVLGEAMNPLKFTFVLVTILGILGLKFTGS